MQAAKPAPTARSDTGRQSLSLFSGTHIRGDGRFFFSAQETKSQKAADKKAYKLFQDLHDSEGSPEMLQFDWRFGNADAKFPNWKDSTVDLNIILAWFGTCEASLEALKPELLSTACKKELDTWTTEFLEVRADLSSWMRKYPNHKVPVQVVFYSSVLFSL